MTLEKDILDRMEYSECSRSCNNCEYSISYGLHNEGYNCHYNRAVPIDVKQGNGCCKHWKHPQNSISEEY